MSDQSYDNRGKTALWKNESTTASAPVLKGQIYAHRDIREGERLDISLWINESSINNAPVLTGKIQDKFVKEPQVSSFPLGDDEDLPF